MNKFLTKVLLLFFLISTNVNSEIISDIEVTGNKRISKETILVLGNIKLNQNFTENDLNNTLKKLYETNFFSNISLSIDSGLLKINLIENPIIKNYPTTNILKETGFKVKKLNLIKNIEKNYIKNLKLFA